MGRTRRIPTSRCSQLCEVESGKRCVRGHLRRPRAHDPRAARLRFDDHVADLRDSFKSHRIIDTARAIDIVRGGGLLNLSPLCGGVPPGIAWPYLKRVGEVVLPEAARTAVDLSKADGLSDAFTELMSTKEI